jgi:murein DD-endopeptidase MepM/ murein hydrolase activator NlpD
MPKTGRFLAILIFITSRLGAPGSSTEAFGAEVFVLPTPNRAIFETGGESRYFTPTPGKDWRSGTFGCVRTDGWQMHEGLDIRHTKTDLRGEALDPIYASVAGRVAYLNHNIGLSNYGKYVVLEHRLQGLTFYTTYAHLKEFAAGLSTGDEVRQGQVIATMGRTSNTRQAISKDRAHLHFEISLRLNDRYAGWHSAHMKGYRNDHGNWNGRNFAGIDPREVLLKQNSLGSKFSFLEFIRSRSELCRVLVRDTRFPWLKANTALIRRNPVADREGVAGYEIGLDFNGVPFLLIPKATSEIGAGPKIELLSVNEKEQSLRPCRKLVRKQGNKWTLGSSGSQLLDLLTY